MLVGIGTALFAFSLFALVLENFGLALARATRQADSQRGDQHHDRHRPHCD
jgi:hypothetical protein